MLLVGISISVLPLIACAPLIVFSSVDVQINLWVVETCSQQINIQYGMGFCITQTNKTIAESLKQRTLLSLIPWTNSLFLRKSKISIQNVYMQYYLMFFTSKSCVVNAIWNYPTKLTAIAPYCRDLCWCYTKYRYKLNIYICKSHNSQTRVIFHYFAFVFLIQGSFETPGILNNIYSQYFW